MQLLSGWQWQFLPSLFRGALVTVLLCVYAAVIGTVAGVILGIAERSKIALIRYVALSYVNLVRGIPLLVIIFFAYFGLPLLVPSLSMSPYLSAVLSLAVYTSAYIAEIFRGSLDSVPKGQTEAALAVGLSSWQIHRDVLLPQAVRVAVPAGVGFLVGLVKESSLVVVVGYIELTQAGNVAANQTGAPFMAYGLVAVLYFVVCYGVSLLGRYLEARMRSAHGTRA